MGTVSTAVLGLENLGPPSHLYGCVSQSQSDSQVLPEEAGILGSDNESIQIISSDLHKPCKPGPVTIIPRLQVG